MIIMNRLRTYEAKTSTRHFVVSNSYESIILLPIQSIL